MVNRKDKAKVQFQAGCAGPWQDHKQHTSTEAAGVLKANRLHTPYGCCYLVHVDFIDDTFAMI